MKLSEDPETIILLWLAAFFVILISEILPSKMFSTSSLLPISSTVNHHVSHNLTALYLWKEMFYGRIIP
jgi:hypothetical protein